MLAVFLVLAGAASVVAGVALVSVPAALVVGGLASAGLGWLLPVTRPNVRPTP